MAHLGFEHYLAAFGISILVIVVITLIARRMIRGRFRGGNFLEIIYDQKKRPNLSIFQFFLWTFVISFTFLSVYLIRMLGGVFELSTEQIPTGILVLMGISSAVPLVNMKLLQSENDSGKKDEDVKPVNGNNNKKRFTGTALTEMLMQKGKATLPRFQMFMWTFIAIIIYLGILFSSISDLGTSMPDNENDIKKYQVKLQKLNLPDIDPALVVLMGLSQGAFVGSEYFTSHRKGSLSTLENRYASGEINDAEFNKRKKKLEEE